MSDIRFDALGPGDYDRAKTVLNKARHPGFVGRELFYRCATNGAACVAVLDDVDVGVALIAKEKLQALSVIVSAQGRGVGQALMARLKPRWVSAIGEKVAWFAKIGYAPYGAAKVGRNGKHAVQLMERVSSGDEATGEASIRPIESKPPEDAEPSPSFLSLLEESPIDQVKAEIAILDDLLAKAILAEKFTDALKIMEQAGSKVHAVRKALRSS